MIFVDVPQHRRLVCSQCDGRNIKVMPIFPPAGGRLGTKNHVGMRFWDGPPRTGDTPSPDADQ